MRMNTLQKTTFNIAKFTNENNRQLTKTIFLGNGGRPTSDSAACFMTRGYGQNVSLHGPDDLANLINGLDSSEALALGVIATDKADRNADDIIDVVTARSLREPRAGVIARTTEYLIFRPREPGFML